MDNEPSSPQASSGVPSEPMNGAVLYDQEVARRNGLALEGNCLTGCQEIDDEVLLGGFERGCVVGISCQEDEIGLVVGEPSSSSSPSSASGFLDSACLYLSPDFKGMMAIPIFTIHIAILTCSFSSLGCRLFLNFSCLEEKMALNRGLPSLPHYRPVPCSQL